MPTASRTARRVAEPLVDVAADQELQGRAASQLQGLGAGRPAGGRQVFPRRLAAAAGVGQGVRPLRPQVRPPSVARRQQLEGQAVQRGGPVEGQGLGRLGRRHGVIVPRPPGLVGPTEMAGQDLGIGPAGGLERLRQAEVMPRQGGRGQAGDDRLADAVVIRLDLVPIRRAGAPDQAAASAGRPAPTARPAPARRRGRPPPDPTAGPRRRRPPAAAAPPPAGVGCAPRAPRPAPPPRPPPVGASTRRRPGGAAPARRRRTGCRPTPGRWPRPGPGRAGSSCPRSIRARASASGSARASRASSRQSRGPLGTPASAVRRARSSGLVAASSLR